MNRFRRRALSASMFIFVGHWCSAANELTLRDALELVSRQNPALGAFATERETTRQQSLSAALSPGTAVEAQFENFAGTGAASGARILETTLQLSHVVELGGKVAARRDLGTTALSRLEASQRAKRADILAEVARRFVHVVSDQEDLATTTRATALAERARDAVQERIKAGATSQIFLGRAEIALARARIDQEHAEHELLSSRVALASLWGEHEPTFETARADLFALPELEPLESYWQRLEANPDLLTFAADERVLEARARLARAQQSPNVTFNAGIRRLEGLDEQALVAGFSVPLGARPRIAPELAALRSERETLTLHGQSRRLELRATMFALYQEALHAHTEANALQAEIRPQAEQVLATSDSGYRTGRFSFAELVDARQQLIGIERDAIRAAAEFHTHLIDMERIAGEAVHALSR
jgi:outer membrane protein, heavy metal efflux system